MFLALQARCFADLVLHCASLIAFNHNLMQMVTAMDTH
jgi:hypothetical protein